jgi:hypothetical protein
MKKKKKKKKVLAFVEVIICLCLLMCILITLVSLWEYHRLSMVMDSGVLAVLFSIWGGELLLIVIRQVLGSDIRKNKPDKTDVGV